MKLELDAPNVGDLEKRYINEAIDKGFVSTFGPLVVEFEEKFARYVNTGKAVSTQSGTAAIHIALHELGIGKDDEVIVPVSTFIATVNPIAYVGAKPVFVDVDIRSWNIDTKEIEKNITKKTKAILPVHLYGNPCNMDEITRIACKNKLVIIEDATESLGSRFKGKHTGAIGDLGCFSFNGNKTITTGGGGMIVGRDAKRVEHIKFLVNQARDESRGYYHPEIGFNYRMTNIEAALGLAQMQRLDSFLTAKKGFADIYKQELSSINSIHFQEEYEGAQAIPWLTCAIFEDEKDISSLQKKLKDRGVPTRRVFMPITEFPPYERYKNGSYKNAYNIYEKGLCLPSSTLNSEKDIRYTCKIIKSIFEHE
jgi:perosamine synthetase